MFKKIFALLLVLFVAVSFVSCDDEEDEKSLIDDYPMGEMTQDEANEVVDFMRIQTNDLYMKALMDAKRSESGDVDWTSEDGKISVTISYSEESESSYYYNVKIKFKDCEIEDLTIFGTVEYVIKMTGDSFEYSYTGDFKVLYKEKRYDFSWNIRINSNYDFEGTYTCNGETYDYTYDPYGDF